MYKLCSSAKTCIKLHLASICIIFAHKRVLCCAWNDTINSIAKYDRIRFANGQTIMYGGYQVMKIIKINTRTEFRIHFYLLFHCNFCAWLLLMRLCHMLISKQWFKWHNRLYSTHILHVCVCASVSVAQPLSYVYIILKLSAALSLSPFIIDHLSPSTSALYILFLCIHLFSINTYQFVKTDMWLE